MNNESKILCALWSRLDNGVVSEGGVAGGRAEQVMPVASIVMIAICVEPEAQSRRKSILKESSNRYTGPQVATRNFLVCNLASWNPRCGTFLASPQEHSQSI